MKKATDIHRKAMDLVDRARAEKARGESRQAEESLRDAFEKEREAALLVVKEEESEPTRKSYAAVLLLLRYRLIKFGKRSGLFR